MLKEISRCDAVEDGVKILKVGYEAPNGKTGFLMIDYRLLDVAKDPEEMVAFEIFSLESHLMGLG